MKTLVLITLSLVSVIGAIGPMSAFGDDHRRFDDHHRHDRPVIVRRGPVVYTPAPVIVAPPPPSPGINLVLPIIIR